MRTLRLHIRHQARHLEIATRSYNELQMAWARASAIAALAIVGSAFVPAFITTAIILPPLDVATAAVAAISDDGKLLQPQSVTVSDTTDRGGYQVSLSFTSPIISDGQNQDIAFRIADALGRPARDIEFTLVLSELTATGSEPRLIAQGQALNGTGQVEREFDSVGWYQVDLSLQNETASFRIFAGGVDLETDDEVYSPGQAIKVSGTTYPNDTVIITLSGSDDGSEATADESNVSSTAPTSIANRTVSTDEDGTFNSTQIMWPTEDGSTKDGLYTVTAYSSLLGMKSEKSVYFSREKPAVDIDIRPIPPVLLAENASESCTAPSQRIALLVNATYPDMDGSRAGNATIRILDLYRIGEETSGAESSRGSDGEGTGEQVSSLTIPDYENQFTYSDVLGAWIGPGSNPLGAYFYTDKTPGISGNYLLPGRYYFTVLFDDGEIKAVERSETFELTNNVTHYLESVGKTGPIEIKPGYNATFAGNSQYNGIDVDLPYEKGIVQYFQSQQGNGTQNATMLNATGWLSLYELSPSAYNRINSIFTDPFNVDLDASDRLIQCSDISQTSVGQFFPLAVQNSSSLLPGDQIAWQGSPLLNATVLGHERIEVMGAIIDTVRVRESTAMLFPDPIEQARLYDPDYSFGMEGEAGDVDAWFEEGTGHLVKFSTSILKRVSDEIGYRPMQVVSVMNSTNMPMQKTYEFTVHDEDDDNDNNNNTVRKVFVMTDATVDDFEYGGGQQSSQTTGTSGLTQNLSISIKGRPSMADELHYLIKVPKTIMAEPAVEDVRLTPQDSAAIIETDVDTSSDQFYGIVEVVVKSALSGGSPGTRDFSAINIAIGEHEEASRLDGMRSSGQRDTDMGVDYPMKPLPFFARHSEPQYYAQKFADAIGLGRLELVGNSSEHDGQCGYSPEDIHSIYRFTPAYANNNRDVSVPMDSGENAATISISMCAGEFSQLSFNALDAGILRERYGYNTTDFAGSSSFPYLPVEGVKDAPFVTKPMSAYSTYVEKTREITQRYLDEIPYLECFSRRQPCDDDGTAADLVFMAPYVRLNQLVLPVQEGSGSDNATVLLLSGADVTASFDNTKGTLVQYSISKLYETGRVAESIKFLPADARNIMGRFWNDTLGLGLNIGGGGDSELGAILTSVCDGRIYYHMDSFDEGRTGSVNIHYFENSVDAVTGDIVTDAQFYAVSGETCPPVERFEDFNITAGLLGENSNDDDYRQEDEINVMLEVTNNGFEDVKYQHLIAGFVAYDLAGMPVAGKLAHFSGETLPDGKQDFMEFPAGQTVVFGPGGDVGTSGQRIGENLAWESPQPGRYHVKVFVLSPFFKIAEFDASVS